MPQNLGANHPNNTPPTTHTASSSAGPFNILFSFINEADVLVFLDGTLRTNGTGSDNYTINAAGTQVTFNNTVSGEVLITRKSELLTKVRTFTPGASIRAADLNTAFDQVQQLIQENYELLRNVILNDSDSEITPGRDSIIANDKVQTASIQASAVTTAKIENNAVDGSKIPANAIDSDHYTDLSIDREHLSNDIIDGSKLADDAVDSEHITDGAIDLVHMSANSVDSDQYVDGSIDLIHMSANSVDSDQYVDGSIDREHLAADVIDGTKIDDDAVDSEHIAAGAIDLEHMSANSVDSDQYVDGSIDLVHMSANSVDSDQYVDGSIDLVHMSANSVDSDQYVDGSIDEEHLADGAVTSTKIADDTIVNADINSSAAIAGSKINMSLNQLSDVNVGTPGAGQDDQVLAWDNANSEFALTTVSTGGGGISDIVDDSTPQLGGMLDVNGNSIGDGTLELLSFSETASAVNEFTIANAVTGNDPVLSATGDDTNIGITINPKGTGDINLDAPTRIDGALTFDSGHQIITTGALRLNSSDSRLQIDKGTNNQPALDLMVNATHSVRIQTPTSLTNNTSYTLTLPQNDGDPNQFLQTDGSGALSWQTVDTTGAASNVVALNNATTTNGFTIAADRNVAMLGPLTVNSGQTITVGSGSKFVILN